MNKSYYNIKKKVIKNVIHPFFTYWKNKKLQQ